MAPLKTFFSRAEEIFASLCLGAMIVLISVQVFRRYVLQSSLDWSEELARYFFIWAVYIGCSFATQQDRHLEVTILRTVKGGKWAKPITILAYVLTVIFCATVAVWGTQMVLFLIKTGQKTQALEIAIFWVYIAIPLGMGLMCLRTLERLWLLVTGKISAAPEHL
ncbi:MAG TPA: TRAP transporter small permease [Desulfofustis sp.]|jgi:C4-dicarboxylate transporter DctQ subunit|nr:TRAP transporter small permease [Desulfofustis sp. PB-SRB1]HBH28005.1 TRAP transporter small permease [Desulfofustis sp.]